MARIPDKEIERLKQEVSIQRLAEARGVILRKRSDELMGLCPFHEDHSPSLVINTTKNVWHCLGACQTGGSVIDWVMKAEGISFRHAVELLLEDASSVGTGAMAPSPVSSTQKVVKRSTAMKLSTLVDTDMDTASQLVQVVDYYHETLKQRPEALGYLAGRGLGCREMVDRFRLGYANRTLGYHLPQKTRNIGAAIRGQLEAVGIFRGSGHEHFAGSLVIPVFDEAGRVTEMYGRKINDKLRKGTSRHLYLPGPHRGVWNIAAFKETSDVILCESLIDALTFWCAGFSNVTASYGVEGFTDDHLDAFKRYCIERVFIAYDRDDAGDKAASSLAVRLMSEGFDCLRIQFPKGMDANEYALQEKPAETSLRLVIEKAVFMGKGKRNVKAVPARRVKGEATKKENTEAASQEVQPPETLCPEAPFDKSGYRPLTDLGDSGSYGLGDFDSSVEAEQETKSPRPPSSKGEKEPASPKGEVSLTLGDRRWRIRGLEKNLSVSVMKVNVLVSIGDAFHVDTFDLYAARHRKIFISQASDELSVNEDVIKRDLGKVLLHLESLQDEQITQALEPKRKGTATLTEAEQSAAMDLLTDPHLLDRILADFERCGVVGEETNKLVGYLAACSRKLEEPLAIVIQSSSAAGKSSLMEAILSFFPPEERVQYSAMTGQSLFYMGEADLQHKILAIAEEEGAEKATYALKLLQSEGELTIASTGKDPATGRLETQEYRVEGPVMIFLTTTAIEIDEELLNRCIVLTVDEEREQTRAIHRLQRQGQTLEGLLARQDRAEVLKLHQDAQRLLRPLLVANPFATELTFLDDRTRTRRDHMKYLTLIRSIALLRQYQRPIRQATHQGRVVSYIDVEVADIEVANRLAHQVLGRSLDELAPQTRRLLVMLDEMVTKRCAELEMARSDFRFTRREVREHSGLGNTRLKIHLHRLEELEYLIVHHGGRGQQFVYELAYEGQGQDGTPFLSGLLDVSNLQKRMYDDNRSPLNADLSGTGRPQVAPKSPPSRPQGRQVSLNDSEKIKPINGKTPKITIRDENENPPYIGSRTCISTPLIQAKGAE